MTHTETFAPTPTMPAFAHLSSMIEDGIQWIHLQGRLDRSGALEIQDAFHQATLSGSGPAIVDLSAVTFMTSIGTRLIVTAAKQMATQGRVLVLLKPQPLVDGYLKAAEIYRLVPVAYGETEAALFLAD